MFAWRAFPSRGERSTGPADQAGPDAFPGGGVGAGAAGAHAATPGAYLTVPALQAAGIRVAFTTRHGGYSAGAFGSLNLSFVSGDDQSTVEANRSRALNAIGARLEDWTSARQVHAAGVARATEDLRGRGAHSPESTIPDTDAIWTDQPSTALAVLTADCVPILLADPERRRIAVVHAGWRGLIAGVVQAAADEMGGASVGVVGPAIGPCCYEVGPEVAEVAREVLGDDVIRANGRAGAHDAAHRASDAVHLDLWRGARIALARANVGRVHVAALCTRCEPTRFYSHRAGDTGRQGVLAMLEPR